MIWTTLQRSGVLSKSLAISAALLAAAGATAARADEPSQAPPALRLCADPANLPFSSDNPAEPGLYREIGEALGKALGRPVAYDWYRTYFGGRAVRATMLAKKCDATIGLPASDDFMGPKVIFSKPLFTLGYALIAPNGVDVRRVEDLKGKRVAVQFQSEPQNIVAPREDMTAVTVMSPEEGMKALDEGRADVAFLWAANAGYLNKTVYGRRYTLNPIEGKGLSFPAAIGYAKASKALRDEIDAVLPEVAKQFPALLAKYGMGPEPVVVASAESASATATDATPAPAKSEQVAALPPPQPPGRASGPPAGDGTGEFDVALSDPSSDEKMIAAGREVFNGTCAHCHGPNAEQSVKKIDLRRLKLRYDAKAVNMFWKTVHEGRPAKGMPTWKGVFSNEQLTQIEAFLFSIQSTE